MASQNPDDCQCEDNPKGKVTCFDCWVKERKPEMYAAMMARRINGTDTQ
jgi:hypothetical protein